MPTRAYNCMPSQEILWSAEPQNLCKCWTCLSYSFSLLRKLSVCLSHLHSRERYFDAPCMGSAYSSVKKKCSISTVVWALPVWETVWCDRKNNMHDSGCGKMKVQGHLCSHSHMLYIWRTKQDRFYNYISGQKMESRLVKLMKTKTFVF